MIEGIQPFSCPYCDLTGHAPLTCPRVSAFEFDEMGRVKRVEFVGQQHVDITAGGAEIFKPFWNTATSHDDSPAE